MGVNVRFGVDEERGEYSSIRKGMVAGLNQIDCNSEKR
jgi:hypothetical protein